jgi:uncharacterized protein YjbI with pentapeptide repeats
MMNIIRALYDTFRSPTEGRGFSDICAEGADFSNQNIRGTDFSDSKFEKSTFSNTLAGYSVLRPIKILIAPF